MLKQIRYAIGMTTALALPLLLPSDSAHSQGVSQETTDDTRPPEKVRKQVIGWYEHETRKLTLLPNDGDLVAVFEWGNRAPQSVGIIEVDDASRVTFVQPKSREAMKPDFSEGQLQSLEVIKLLFRKQAGLEGIIGNYVNEKGQRMTITLRDKNIACSIEWGNNAPRTNGWIRADPNGTTVLKGFQWQDNVELSFRDDKVQSITIVGSDFVRREP